jgi:fructan beta-fructosidase
MVRLTSNQLPLRTAALRDALQERSFKVNGTRTIKEMIPGNDGAYEIETGNRNQRADVIGFRLYNDKGEEVDMQYDMKEKKFSMDRRKSGEVSFNENFPMLTWTAIEQGRKRNKAAKRGIKTPSVC